ncbi:hypothetical protein, partial [Comamonas aquatica]
AQPPGLATLQQLRTQLGTALSPDQALALFAVEGPVCTLLVSDSDTSPPVRHHLPLGLQSLSQRSFQLRMPTPAQLETGIMEVEDAVMPLARLLPAHTLLATRDPLLRHLALQAVGGHAPGEVPAITREAIEALFERLVAQSSRHYSHQAPDLPPDPRAAAALLVLREILHHWQCTHLWLLPDSVDAAP